jgi:hypothetical protein
MHPGSWIGVDLDGTLAEYHGWKGEHHIGLPIQAMADRVVKWHKMGMKIKIFTARATTPGSAMIIKNWLETHGLPDLEVTNIKDFQMVELWDDRAVGVEPNTGVQLNRSRVFDKEI